ncbi:MAG: chemotaxis protein CheX [Bellilinea sp.]|jgi:chemotaxis protein CheX
MNVKFLNPFVEAAYEVLQAETGVQVERGELSLEQGMYITDDVTVILSLVGAVEGTVFYSLNKSSALRCASLMLGEPLDEFDGLAQSGIAEIGNVITGRASMKLSQSGFESNISTPSLILGSGASISTLDYPRLVVPLLTEVGSVTIHLALREGKRGLKTPQIAMPSGQSHS